MFVIGTTLLTSRPNSTTKQNETTPQQPSQTPVDQELQSYYDSYKDPFVLQIRTTLNNYLNEPESVPESLVEEGFTMGRKTGLSSFSKDYYKGKFVVIDIGNFPGGGKQVNILFPDKPDKVFWVWVYKLGGDGGYEVRGFAENPSYTQEKIDYLIEQYTQLINDKEHSL
ncbi:MAG: hypothetical protein KatS3mg101_0084 [Patescibacteria group bacterium]|nr:MAG: hypothetical protein KatS3mg101_0084 [Patescibacteria group bacterium]